MLCEEGCRMRARPRVTNTEAFFEVFLVLGNGDL